MGIRFSSVNRPQMSSALACSVALTSTVAVLLTFEPEAFSSTFFDAVAASFAGGAGAYDWDWDGPEGLGVDAPDVASDVGWPCAAIKAGRKELNFSLRSGGKAWRR